MDLSKKQFVGDISRVCARASLALSLYPTSTSRRERERDYVDIIAREESPGSEIESSRESRV